ncbi:hypothetical protein ACA910_016800 [Epithemia clementina (nom. ined.)]
MEHESANNNPYDAVIRLRATIETKPRNARLMSKLSCLLHAQQQRVHSSKPEGGSINYMRGTIACSLSENEMDPLYWAKKATEIAPDKPFGYMALSMVHSQLDVRQENLHKAIRLAQGLESFRCTWIGLLVRSLVEPRQEESLRVRGSVGKAAPSHPSRRSMSIAEQDIYQNICFALEHFWLDYEESPEAFANDAQTIAVREYKMGLFFRKMQPEKTYRINSIAHFKRVLQYSQPNHEHWSLARFWLATMSQEAKNEDGSRDSLPAMDRCPIEYVVGLYSTFAEGFDKLLGKLSYQTPKELRSLLDEQKFIEHRGSLFKRAIDLGCGTGLSGLAFRNCTTRLEGVDLSPEMIEKARERGCYDSLGVGDILDIFQHDCKTDDEKDSFQTDNHPKEPASLVIACDVFCYIGDLQQIFARVHEALEPSGIFAFSTELLIEPEECSNDQKKKCYQLHNCARFAHSQSYIDCLAKGKLGNAESATFSVVAMKRAVLRKNQGDDVHGLLSILRKI